MDLIERLDSKRIEEISDAIERFMPEGWGQLPFILLHQIRARFPDYEIDWTDMQLAFNKLHSEGRIYPEQNFSRSIIRRAYKN